MTMIPTSIDYLCQLRVELEEGVGDWTGPCLQIAADAADIRAAMDLDYDWVRDYYHNDGNEYSAIELEETEPSSTAEEWDPNSVCIPKASVFIPRMSPLPLPPHWKEDAEVEQIFSQCVEETSDF